MCHSSILLIDLSRNGIIKEISENIPSTEEMLVINAEGLLLLPGVVDTHVHFRDPGFEYKEDIRWRYYLNNVACDLVPVYGITKFNNKKYHFNKSKYKFY